MRAYSRSVSAGCALVFSLILAPLTHAQRDDETDAFVRGFVRFLAYHEAGHMLMGQIADINSSSDWSNSDREDYADQFAMVLLQPDANDPEGVDEIISAAAGWLQVDSSQVRDEPHAPAEVRAVDIICLLYGSNPSQFASFADAIEQGRDCRFEYQQIEAEIENVFRDYSGQMGQEVNIVYAAPGIKMEGARQFLENSAIMEDLKFDIESDFYLTHRTTLQAMSCEGKAKADTFYSDRVRGATPADDHFVITLCYEMIDARLKYGMRGFE